MCEQRERENGHVNTETHGEGQQAVKAGWLSMAGLVMGYGRDGMILLTCFKERWLKTHSTLEREHVQP